MRLKDVLSKIFLIIIVCSVLLYFTKAYSKYGAPTEFGNASITTCFVGGDLGIINCTGNITTTSGYFVGDGSALTGISAGGSGNCSESDSCANILYDGDADKNCSVAGSCSSNAYMDYPNSGNFNVSDNVSAANYKNASGALDWIGPENIRDVDLEDICLPGETCPFVRITGDNMTGDLRINEKFNVSASEGNVAMDGNLTIGGGSIKWNGSHLIFT